MFLFGCIVLAGTPTPRVWGQGVQSGAASPPQVTTTGHRGLRAASPGTWRVLEATRVGIEGDPKTLAAGMSVSTGRTLRLGDGSHVQLLLNEDLLLSAVGPGQVILGSPLSARDVRVMNARIVQMSGREGTLALKGRTIVLGPQGATALMNAGHLYVRRGTLRVHPAPDKATPAPTTTAPAATAPTTTAPTTTAPAATAPAATAPATTARQRQRVLTLRRGESVRLSDVGDLRVEVFQTIPRDVLRAISRYRAPAPWKRQPTRSLQAILRHLRRHAQAQRTVNNDNVSRALTGPNAPGGLHLYDGVNATPTLEGRNATLGVRIRGIPHAPATEAKR